MDTDIVPLWVFCHVAIVTTEVQVPAVNRATLHTCSVTAVGSLEKQ
jgi:hypothetical protein